MATLPTLEMEALKDDAGITRTIRRFWPLVLVVVSLWGGVVTWFVSDIRWKNTMDKRMESIEEVHESVGAHQGVFKRS